MYIGIIVALSQYLRYCSSKRCDTFQRDAACSSRTRCRNRLPATVFVVKNARTKFDTRFVFGGPLLYYTLYYVVNRTTTTVYRQCLYALECDWNRGGSMAWAVVDWCSGPAVIDRRQRRLYINRCIYIYIYMRISASRESARGNCLQWNGDGEEEEKDVAFKRNSRRRWRWLSGYIRVWCTLKLVGCI